MKGALPIRSYDLRILPIRSYNVCISHIETKIALIFSIFTCDYILVNCHYVIRDLLHNCYIITLLLSAIVLYVNSDYTASVMLLACLKY